MCLSEKSEFYYPNKKERRVDLKKEEVVIEARRILASVFTERRRELGLTQEQLAEKTGLAANTIRRLEAAKFDPKLSTLLTLSQSLNLFFFWEEKEGDTPLAKLMRERWGKQENN